MSKKKIFDSTDEQQEKQYQEEAVNRWGNKVTESANLWNSYSDERKEEIKQEGNAIYEEIVANMGKGADSPEVRALLVQWHEHLRNFYEPSIELLGGLGDMYNDDPEFNANFTKLHPDLPGFLKEAIAVYVDELETKWLERELGILEE